MSLMFVLFWRCEEAKWEPPVESHQLGNLASLLIESRVVGKIQHCFVVESLASK